MRLSVVVLQQPHIRPRTPHLNGKVERSHRVDDQEFYQLLERLIAKVNAGVSPAS